MTWGRNTLSYMSHTTTKECNSFITNQLYNQTVMDARKGAGPPCQRKLLFDCPGGFDVKRPLCLCSKFSSHSSSSTHFTPIFDPFMKKQSSKPTKTTKSHASFSRTELAAKLGVDVRTIDRRCGVLGVKPSKRLPGKAVTYKLTPEQLDQLQHRLDHARPSQPPSDLRQSKLAEEIELLRLKNKKLRCETTSNHVLAEILGGLASSTAGLIRQKLEIEFPVMCAGLSEDEIRKHTAELVAVIVSKWDGEAAKWAKYADQQG